jgi:hypothetical protein
VAEACRSALLVRFSRPYEEGTTDGYILDIGTEFFMLGVVEYDLRFDGFVCLRTADVRQLKVPHPHADFIVAALRKRRQAIKRKPDIDLRSLPALLRSVSRLFPLVTTYRELLKPDVCEIGQLVEVTETHLFLHEIDPDAIWEEKITRIRLSDITRVDFGGGYEEALHLVGGKPKQLVRIQRRTNQ